jgi:hypothetical protein
METVLVTWSEYKSDCTMVAAPSRLHRNCLWTASLELCFFLSKLMSNLSIGNRRSASFYSWKLAEERFLVLCPWESQFGLPISNGGSYMVWSHHLSWCRIITSLSRSLNYAGINIQLYVVVLLAVRNRWALVANIWSTVPHYGRSR